MDEPRAGGISREEVLALSFVNQETGVIEASKLSRAKRVKLAELWRRRNAARKRVKRSQLDRGIAVTKFWSISQIRRAEAEGQVVLGRRECGGRLTARE